MRRAGIDVGGTKFLGVVIDDDGTVLTELRRATPVGPEALVEELVLLANDLGSHDSLGVGVPGLVTRTGILRSSPHLAGVEELDLGRRLSAAFGAAVPIDNDATCAALAEWQVGAGRASVDMVMVTLGTGIGGGIVIDGRLRRGRNGFAGEFGHMVVVPDGVECPCGRRGCWERYAAGTGLAHIAREALGDRPRSRMLELAGSSVDLVRGEHVQRAASEGDPLALEVIDRFGRWVALGLVNLANALDPEIFVLGGGLAATPDLYLGPIRTWFHELLYAPELRPHPSIEFAQLGERAGAIGAAMLGAHH